ncbi:MAG: metabolite traffic protein EboE [Phycisphaerales bacterium]|nr:metabolite traffic protein EboE [Phycisphaerales bacterium]
MKPGWCTNVLPTQNAEDLAAALSTHVLTLPQGTPIGLWLPDELLGDSPRQSVQPIKDVLDSLDTTVLGLNAFPQRDFHKPVVKDAVYQPAWDNPSRLEYTLRAAEAAASLCSGNEDIGLTTLPVGWPSHNVDLVIAADLISHACRGLAELSDRCEQSIYLAIEPEPGCILPTALSLIEFVQTNKLEKYCESGTLRACLDTCHLAVEHEDPQVAVHSLMQAGIRIGRLQISSAPEAHCAEGITKMLKLAEPRWMHQTSICRNDGMMRFQDLPDAANEPHTGIWRSHLHVPVHRDAFGALRSTQSWIPSLLSAVAATEQRPPVEVETYAWDVLPASMRLASMQEDIARELEWTTNVLREVGW